MLKPLEAFGITGFFFIRMYPNGEFINLTSGTSWADFFFRKFYDGAYKPEDLQIHTYVNHGVALSEFNPQNQSWQDGKDYFNAGNIIIISKKFDHYYENYYFHSNKDNHAINHFYLSNLDLFYKFVAYFKLQAMPLIKTAEENKFITPDKYLLYRKNIFEEDKKILVFPHELSSKEIACISYLIQGKSAEEISIILSRSRRTIETHIESAKKKLNCQKISQLAYLVGQLNIKLDVD